MLASHIMCLVAYGCAGCAGACCRRVRHVYQRCCCSQWRGRQVRRLRRRAAAVACVMHKVLAIGVAVATSAGCAALLGACIVLGVPLIAWVKPGALVGAVATMRSRSHPIKARAPLGACHNCAGGKPCSKALHCHHNSALLDAATMRRQQRLQRTHRAMGKATTVAWMSLWTWIIINACIGTGSSESMLSVQAPGPPLLSLPAPIPQSLSMHAPGPPMMPVRHNACIGAGSSESMLLSVLPLMSLPAPMPPLLSVHAPGPPMLGLPGPPMLGLPKPGPSIVPARQRAPPSEASSAGKSAPSDGAGGNAAGADGTARMLGKCRLKSGGDDVNRDDLDDDDSDDSADSYDSGDSERLDMLDELVGATGVQYTERTGVEAEPGIPYYAWYSRRGQYFRCRDTDCPCVGTRDGDGQSWCGQPDVSFEPCIRPDCPCPASWNGQGGQHCGRTCQQIGACSSARHLTPSGAAAMGNLAARRFAVVSRVRNSGPYVYMVQWDDDPGRDFFTELHPRMFIPWPENMPCPVPSSHPARYEWTLDATQNGLMVAPPGTTEGLVEWMAQTRGYLPGHHSAAAPGDAASGTPKDGSQDSCGASESNSNSVCSSRWFA